MNDPIHFLDLKKQSQAIKAELFAAMDEVFDQAYFSGGQFIEDFEQSFAAYCHTKYAVACNNGTSALQLALLTLDLSKDDEVIVPANTYIASALAVSHCQAKPIFVDCDPVSWQISAESVQKAITSKTKGIIGVHLYGQPFDVDEIQKIAKQHNLFLIEDASQAHGAKYKNSIVGSLSDLACFSFYPTKNLGACGEAGAITTNNTEYLERMKMLRNHGSRKKYHHDSLGYNMRMGNLESAILKVKLKYLDQWNARRKEIAQIYREEITNPLVTLQYQPNFTESVYHLFVITSLERDKLVTHLNKKQIFPGIHYPIPCHLQKAYNHLAYQKGDLPISEWLADHCLSLPMYPELTDNMLSRIINAVNQFSI